MSITSFIKILMSSVKNRINGFDGASNENAEPIPQETLPKEAPKSLPEMTNDHSIKKPKYSLDINKVESFPITVNNEKRTSISLNFYDQLEYDPGLTRISYVSDLHILHKLHDNNADTVEKIQCIIDAFAETIACESEEVLLIGGDVSSDFEIFELFLKTLREKIRSYRYSHARYIFIVLGNHEFWDFSQLTVDEIVSKYKNLAKKYGMYVLHNEVAYINRAYLDKNNMPIYEKLNFILTDELNTLEKKELYNRLRIAGLIIFGGTGFSGYSDEFNANDGIYRSTITREQEIDESLKFNTCYKRILTALPDKKVIVLSHTPMNSWSDNSDYHSNYVYVNGHTHKNFRYDDGEIRVYSDNQIGYKNNHPHLKYFYYDKTIDYFGDYKEGIYKISRFEYLQFYRCKNIWPKFNKEYDVLYMLKKKDYYCFIISRKNKLLILNGGKDYLLPGNYDIYYYYNYMDLVIENIESPLSDYTSLQKKVSHEIKMLGGEGRIHGCIIDIDFYNHVYVNPTDHKITAYYATDTSDKWVYSSVAALLKDVNLEMYNRYTNLINKSQDNLPCIYSPDNDEKHPQQYLEKDIYVVSRELCKLQKLHSNILTVWRTPGSSKGNLLPG